MNDLVVLYFIMPTKNIKGVHLSHFLGFEGHRMELGDGVGFKGWNCNFGIYEPIWSCYTSKCSQKNIKGVAFLIF